MFLFLFIILSLLAFVRAVDPCDGTTTTLNLGGQGLTVVPDLSMCTALVSLDLRNNALTTLPAAIGQLVNLQFLELRSNQLTALPTEIGMLANLQFFGPQ